MDDSEPEAVGSTFIVPVEPRDGQAVTGVSVLSTEELGLVAECVVSNPLDAVKLSD